MDELNIMMSQLIEIKEMRKTNEKYKKEARELI